MTITKKNQKLIGSIIFSLGVLLGILVNGLGVIGDLAGAGFWDPIEALIFDHDQKTDVRLGNLKCPLLMTSGESGSIIATIKNNGKNPSNLTVQAYISDPEAPNMRGIFTRVVIDPGKNQVLQWNVTQNDVVWNNFILFRATLYISSPYPSQTGSCGIVYLNLANISGNLIILIIMAASILCMLASGLLLLAVSQPLRDRTIRIGYGLGILAGIIIAGMLANLIGWWIISGLLLLFTLLLIIAIVPDMLRVN